MFFGKYIFPEVFPAAIHFFLLEKKSYIFLCLADGVVKTFEAESGKLVSTVYEHKGWVTDFMYW